MCSCMRNNNGYTDSSWEEAKSHVHVLVLVGMRSSLFLPLKEYFIYAYP
jgi:primosomal protein N'